MAGGTKTTIHLWVPGIRDDSGGIQAFSLYLCRALVEGFPQHHLRVLVKSERPDDGDVVFKSTQVSLATMARFPAPLRTIALATEGMLAAIRERPALIITSHLHFLPAIRFAQKFCHARIASVLHGIEAWRELPSGRLRALRSADNLFAVSRFTCEEARKRHGLDARRIAVLPNTFDPVRFSVGAKPSHLLERHGLRQDQPVILTVSRLAASEQRKGHDQVIRSLAIIRQRFPSVRYIIGGDGPYRRDLEALAENLGLAEHVIFTGRIAGEELPSYYRLCDLFAMPSTKEGFGIVFLEAMACGKPVIAGNLDGSVDALAEGKLGALVNPNDVDEIARTAVQILDGTHPNRLLFDAEGLRREVIRQFGWEAFVANVKRAMTPLIESTR